MKLLFHYLMLFCCFEIATGQESSGTLEGFVLKSQSDIPFQGANVILVGTTWGDATDKNGYFKIEHISPGEYEIEVQFIGYEVSRQKLHIKPDETLKIVVNLEPKALEGAEVTVEGERAGDIRLEITPPSYKLKPEEMTEMSGTLEDVIRSVFSLPGVQSTNDFSNQFIVRGGGPDQNLILLDDVEIFNPYRNSGMPSLINPDIIKEVNLYAGAYPAIFGDRLSSVLTIHSRDGSRQKWFKGKLGLNLANASFLFEGKVPVWNGSWLISSRKTYNQVFAKSFVKQRTPNNVALPDFEDWHVKVALHPSSKHRLQFHSILARNNQDFLVKDELGEQDTERDNFDGEDKIKTNVVGASWNYLPSPNFQTRIHANFYGNRGNSSFAGDFIPSNDANISPAAEASGIIPPVFAGGDSTFLFDHNQQFSFRKLSFGGWLVYELGKHTIESGFGFDFFNNSVSSELNLNEFGEVVFDALQAAPNWFGALGDSIDQRKSYRRSYFYLQDKWTVFGSKFIIQPGLRFDYYDLIGRGYISPRLKVSYELDPLTSISGAWGIYRQSPGFEKLLDGGRMFDLLRFEDLSGLSAERAIHSIFSVQRWLTDQWHLTFEAYHKRFYDLIEQTTELVEHPVANYNYGAPALAASYLVQNRMVYRKIPIPTNDVTGNAYGLDVRLEKRVNDPSDSFFGWLSYSLGKSTRKQTFDGLRISYPYDYDRRHSLDLVLNYRIDSNLHKNDKFIVGLTWRYGTGFPYTPALSVEPLVGTIAPDTTNPDVLKNFILSDPETGTARFVPTFGGPENINSLRYPDYQRLDARITYETKIFKANWRIYLDFINILARKNVLFYRTIIKTEVNSNLPPSLQFQNIRAFEEPVYMYPFFPSLGVSITF